MTTKLPELVREATDPQYWIEYWESRCRLAVEALRVVRERGDTDDSASHMYWAASDALKAIGPLPERTDE
jgi:hypothetical protein